MLFQMPLVMLAIMTATEKKIELLIANKTLSKSGQAQPQVHRAGLVLSVVSSDLLWYCLTTLKFPDPWEAPQGRYSMGFCARLHAQGGAGPNPRTQGQARVVQGHKD